jgi:hypothetical protein
VNTSRQLTADDARQSLRDHVATKGRELREKFSPHPTWADLPQILRDRTLVRYPVEIIFDAAPLQPGEPAFAQPLGERPESGFRIAIHPQLESAPDDALCAVLYQLVAVNYGVFASAEDAETFGAAALGLHQDAFYAKMCALSDALAAGTV